MVVKKVQVRCFYFGGLRRAGEMVIHEAKQFTTLDSASKRHCRSWVKSFLDLPAEVMQTHALASAYDWP